LDANPDALALKLIAALGDDVDDQRPEEPADDLADDVEGQLLRLGLADDPQAEGHRRVDVAARDGADGVRGDQQREAEGERHAEDADRPFGEEGAGGQNGGARASDDEDHRPDGLRDTGPEATVHGVSFRSAVLDRQLRADRPCPGRRSAACGKY
jgi:hypothetical protein